MPSSGRKPLPPLLFLVALLLELALHFLLPVAHLVPPPWNLLGLTLIVGGLAITVIADQQFTRARTPVNPFASPSTLVTHGAFRFSRNPMYLGMVAALAGVGVILGTLTPLSVPLVYAAIIQQQFIRAEEVTLLQRFGPRYATYAERVRRWL
ncbi:MAG TPA: isoprenylcysteine carboxylmethyltransferase family protein [Gemmatimonadales bacterium]|nr:isoprenylcysteine carboxylmethyltransferase family protein [Gemmatimonadales bacterium]